MYPLWLSSSEIARLEAERKANDEGKRTSQGKKLNTSEIAKLGTRRKENDVGRSEIQGSSSIKGSGVSSPCQHNTRKTKLTSTEGSEFSVMLCVLFAR